MYGSAHREWRNRWIHYVMIPVECVCFQIFLSMTLGTEANVVVGVFLAVLSVLMATKMTIGVLCAVFHLAATLATEWFTDTLPWWPLFVGAWIAWGLAWAVQVCVGHYICEQNQPNVANMSTVSNLSITLSVLIAWST